jgi:hypothetical protein
MGRMTARKKVSTKEIEKRLVSDANDDDAWEAPLKVPASPSARPASYGRTKHLELAAKFYVLSVLHRLGAEANLTFAQPDNVDITVVRQSGEAFTIDVKTLLGTSQWHIEQLRARKHHFVVFIRYASPSTDPELVPSVYIWSSERLKAFIGRVKKPTLSIDDVATKLDSISAWQQFAPRSAA